MGYSKLRKITLPVLAVTLMLAGCGNNDSVSTDAVEISQPKEVELEKIDEAKEDGELVIREQLVEAIKDIRTDEDKKLNCFLEPALQNATENSVVVQWFTEDEGASNEVILYENLPAECVKENSNKLKISSLNDGLASLIRDNKEDVVDGLITPTRHIEATTIKLSRIRGGKTSEDKYDASIGCDIYKHVAIVDNLPIYDGNIANRVTYSVKTDDNESYLYTLAANPAKGTGMKVLLTSDHQIKPMTAANIDKVYESVGNVDAIFFNGDLVDVIDSAYDWFYADNAFWRVMTGTASSDVNGKPYNGAALVQEAPIYTTMGNHDVMGVYDDITPLDEQFNNPKPYDFNITTYTEMFELPESLDGSEKYYAASIGDIRLVALDVNRVWRLPNVGLPGKYSEIPGMGEETYGYGDFIFEPVDKDSAQIKFLESELQSSDYQESKYKIVMFHHEAHSLGSNQIPAFTDPVASKAISPITGQEMVVYDYPIENDYIINVIEPLLEDNNTQLLFEAHSHIWNRFVTPSGMNILETSNVGNDYGGFASDDEGEGRISKAPSALKEDDQYHAIESAWNEGNYVLKGDPNGLMPEYPNKAKLPDDKPYLASNTITAFSILDTDSGCVDSYYYDTENHDSEVILFDSFSLTN